MRFREKHMGYILSLIMALLVFMVAAVAILGFGLVAKIDMSELREPFVQSRVTIFMVSIIGIILGTFLFLRIVNPMIAKYQDAEKMIRTIFDNIAVPIVKIDQNGIIEEFNQAAGVVFGYALAEVIGQNITMLMPEDSREKHQSALTRFVTGEKNSESSIINQRVEITGQHKDGSQIPLELAVSIIHQGDVVSFVGVLRDLTAQKNTEVALMESENQTKAILNNANAVIFLKDPKGRFLFINHRFSELFQINPEDVKGKTDFDLFPREMAKQFRANDLEVLRVGNAIEREEIAPSPDGTTHTYISIKFPLYDANGKVYGVCGIATDITKRKKNEEELRKNKEWIEQILNSLGEGVYGVDTEGFCTFCNSAAQEMFDCSAGEMMGCNMHGLIHHGNADGTESASTECNILSAFREKRKVHRDDEVFFRKDGTSFAVEYRANPIFDDSKPVGGVVSFSDITKRKKMEAVLKQAKEDAESANKAKSSFLAVMSHEIHTPMNVIIGMTNLVLQTELTSKQRKYLENVIKSSNSLLLILNGLLDMAKIESGKMYLEEVPFDLKKAIEDVALMFAVLAEQKGLKLTLSIDQDLPPYRRGDPLRFQQILRNIVGNALKFTEKGSVTITVKAIDKDGILFSVADTGIGIPKHRQDAVLSAFSQADESTTRRFGGTGLGTSIAKNLITLMGGDLWFESVEGDGTTFFFTIHLPVEDESQLKIDIRHRSELSVRLKRRLKILAVDDQVDNLNLIQIYLEKQSHDGYFVQSGQSAVEAFETSIQENHPFDIILMDVQMSEMDGLEATRIIRQKDRGTPTPIIALTAGLTPEEREACEKASMNAVIGKPVDFEELFDLIAKHLPGRSKEVRYPLSDQSVAVEDFPSITGIDVSSALKRFGSDWIAYKKALCSFLVRYAGELEKLVVMIHEGNREEAKRLTHSLRGVAANLGAKELVNAATKLESMLKSEVDLNDDLITLVIQAFEVIKASVKSLPVEVDAVQGVKKPVTESLAEISRVLTDLEKALETQRPDQVESCLGQLQKFELPSGLTAKLEKSIACYDFRQAKAILSKIISTMQ